MNTCLRDKEYACQAGDEGSIPVSGRVPERGNMTLHYSCLGYPYGPWKNANLILLLAIVGGRICFRELILSYLVSGSEFYKSKPRHPSTFQYYYYYYFIFGSISTTYIST